MAYGGEPIYDEYGFDEDGYDEYGFDEDGLDGDGYDKDEYDSDGYNPVGIDYEGYNQSGFNWRGLDRDGNQNATETSFSEEKGIYIGGYEGSGHIWKEIEKYFPNIDARRKREIILGKNQKGEIIVGLKNKKSRTFKLFTASTGDDFIVNKSLLLTIKKILGIPEEERTYKYRKNAKNEEIENLKKEIERMKIKNKKDREYFFGYKKEVEQWGEDKNKQIEQMILGQTGAGEKSEEIIKLKVEIKNLTDQIRDSEQMIIKKMKKTIGGNN